MLNARRGKTKTMIRFLLFEQLIYFYAVASSLFVYVCVCRLLFVCVFSVSRFIVPGNCTRSSTFIKKLGIKLGNRHHTRQKTRHRHFTRQKTRQLGIVRHYFCCARANNGIRRNPGSSRVRSRSFKNGVTPLQFALKLINQAENILI